MNCLEVNEKNLKNPSIETKGIKQRTEKKLYN